MLNPGTLSFLKKLAKSNNREWFEKNRGAYEEAKSDMIGMISEVVSGFGKKDPTIAALSGRDCLYRINRDIRFSKDKSPYKKNMAASLISGGKKSDLAGYYIHIEPGSSFIGGGKYMTDPPMLKRIRQEIDYNWEAFRAILRSRKFVSVYGDLDKSPEFSLSREPKDYEKDNPAIDYIKLKSWIAFHPLTDAELTDKTLVKKIIQSFEALQPMIYFLNRAIE
ncbi:DUF2461 domain-containing protein [Sediminibacterium soli]|uniref:DUF2461 domain-containing protein n=1 Tax=Sediminibacterium soli TaxID=2698829 RepID=UPI001379DFA9|nr:DUF2461 domain-containing protein [Sediminibacterium soli]NCI45338.1 DUF2461 domain-containing protein [Sediminibacterium soli]